MKDTETPKKGVAIGGGVTTIMEDEKMNREEIEKALDQIRPSLMAHGGGVELVDFTEDGVVQVRLTGSCGGCPYSQMTLKAGVERGLMDLVPGIKEVVSV